MYFSCWRTRIHAILFQKQNKYNYKEIEVLLFLLILNLLFFQNHNNAISLNNNIDKTQEQEIIIGSQQAKKYALLWENRVYLATFPRSGNHWMRYLIEETTHKATSSSYIDPDPPHLEDIFPWGAYCCEKGYDGNKTYPTNGEIAVVKTHFPTMHISHFDSLPYKKALRIIRHPIDSFYSLYVWEQRYHNQPIEEYVPTQRIKGFIRNWIRFQEYWDRQDNTLTIRYEDMLDHPEEYLSKSLDFIGYKVNQEDISRAVNRYPSQGGKLKHIKHFHQKDIKMINEELSFLLKRYRYTIDSILPILN